MKPPRRILWATLASSALAAQWHPLHAEGAGIGGRPSSPDSIRRRDVRGDETYEKKEPSLELLRKGLLEAQTELKGLERMDEEESLTARKLRMRIGGIRRFIEENRKALRNGLPIPAEILPGFTPAKERAQADALPQKDPFRALLRELGSAIDEEEERLVECALWTAGRDRRTPEEVLDPLRKAGAKVESVEARILDLLPSRAGIGKEPSTTGTVSDGSCLYPFDEAVERVLALSERVDRLRIHKRIRARESGRHRDLAERMQDALEIGGGLPSSVRGIDARELSNLERSAERESGLARQKRAERRKAADVHDLLARRLRTILGSKEVLQRLGESGCIEIGGGWMRAEKRDTLCR